MSTTQTKIEWTDATWSPVRGCSIVSDGCTRCYAMRQAHRFSNPGGPYEGLTRQTKGGPRWTGKIRLVPELLDEPLRWRKPRRVFVNSMSDLFHEDVPDEFICRVFGKMLAAERHTFQVLTKRPERARALLRDIAFANDTACFGDWDDTVVPWPLPNVWLGVSVENRETLWRIAELLKTPAAVRFLSLEPLLEHVSLSGPWGPMPTGIDWVIVGGESGPGARPCDVAWIRSIVEQCRAARVPVFTKQLGSNARWDGIGLPPGCTYHDERGEWVLNLRDRKGGSMEDFPEDLRVRQFPMKASET